MKPKSLWKLLKTIVIKWLDDDPFQSAAALSYYTLFSLAPLLIISIAVAGFVFGHEAAHNQIVTTIQGLVGRESAEAVQAMIQSASNRPESGMLSSLIGGIVLLFGAGGVVGQLQTSLNAIWGVKAQSDSGVHEFIRRRFISFAMVLAVGFLLLVSLAISALISGVAQFMGGLIGEAALIAHVLDILLSFGFITLLFATIYKLLPDVQIQWNDVLTGAAMTSDPVHHRKIPYWALLGQQRYNLDIWGRRIDNHGVAVGLLFRADILTGCGIHASLCGHVWVRVRNERCRNYWGSPEFSQIRLASSRACPYQPMIPKSRVER